MSIRTPIHAITPALALLLAFGTLFTPAPTLAAAAPATTTLRIATEGQAPPFNYYVNDKLTGFEVDLGNALAEEMKRQPQWKAYPFDSLLIGLKEHRFDLVIASHGITTERAKAVDFTLPHYCSGGVIVSRAGGPKSAAELKGKKVAVQVGSTYWENAKKVPGISEFKTYPSDTSALQNFLAKRADAWITDRFLALEAVKKTQPGEIQIGDLLFSEKIAMAVAKGNSQLLHDVNRSLSKLLTNGTYAKLSQKYFSQDIRCRD